MKEIVQTVVLPDGKKALEIMTIGFDGNVQYTYQHHTYGRTLNISIYNKNENGMIIGRLAEW